MSLPVADKVQLTVVVNHKVGADKRTAVYFPSEIRECLAQRLKRSKLIQAHMFGSRYPRASRGKATTRQNPSLWPPPRWGHYHGGRRASQADSLSRTSSNPPRNSDSLLTRRPGPQGLPEHPGLS